LKTLSKEIARQTKKSKKIDLKQVHMRAILSKSVAMQSRFQQLD